MIGIDSHLRKDNTLNMDVAVTAKAINQDTMPINPKWPKKTFFWLFSWNIWLLLVLIPFVLAIAFYFLIAHELMPDAIRLITLVTIACLLFVLGDYILYRYILRQYKKFCYELNSEKIIVNDFRDKEWDLDYKKVYKVYLNQDFLDKKYNFYTVIIELFDSNWQHPIDKFGKWRERWYRKSYRISYQDDFIVIPGLSKENAFNIKEFILRKIDQPQEKNVSKNTPYKI
jgi:hypothetical protein